MTNRSLRRYATWVMSGIILFSLLLSACARDKQQAEIKQISQRPVPGAECGTEPTAKPKISRMQRGKEEPLDTSSLPESVSASPAARGRSTQDCYHLQSAASQQKKIKGRRCEPQSLPFARCRSGINSCCLGWNNGPLTWFACEKKRGNTSPIPSPNSVLILAANKHNMPTGHVAYIEDVIAEDSPNYRIIFSHTNYDRNCSLETKIEAKYNSSAKTLDILNGAWKDWGQQLPVAGFILK